MNSDIRLLTKDAVFQIESAPPIHLRDIVLEQGEIVLVTGASGSGKTCFLDRLTGEGDFISGTVNIYGRIVRIHQDLRLVRERTALGNVMDGAIASKQHHSKITKHENEQYARFLLMGMGLGDKLDCPVYLLSQGEAQRTAIARALMAKPELLLADEPFSALDEDSAQRTLALLAQICSKDGMAALIVTHKIPEYAANPKIRQQEFLKPVAEESTRLDVAEHNNMTNKTHVSHIMAWFVLIIFGLTAIFWLAPELHATHFSLDMFTHFMAQWLPSSEEWRQIPWPAIIKGLADTVTLAVLGTLLAIVASLPLAVLATRGLAPKVVSIPIRYLLNWWRAIPSIIWALIGVAAVGLGVFSGLLALVLYSMGYLTKFFYESFEQVDRKPAQYLASLGASHVMIFVRAILPMTMRAILSSCLFMLEYNIRAASVLGIVGAGGIGMLLKESIEWANWHIVGVIIALLGLLVLMMDAISSWLRRSLLAERNDK